LSDNDVLILSKARGQSAEFRIVNGIVWTKYDKIVVPSICVVDVISLAHDLPTAGHFGVRKTVKTLQQHYYW
jgi:Integrase zinc binding domain